MVAAVEELSLAPLLDRRAEDLSYGQRRLVAIARAVASSPSVLLLDEPAAGLDETESAELGRLVRRLADEWGMGVLLIEHDVALVLANADRVVVLDFGHKIAEGAPAEIRTDPAVRKAYLGEETEASATPSPTPPGMMTRHDRRSRSRSREWAAPTSCTTSTSREGEPPGPGPRGARRGGARRPLPPRGRRLVGLGLRVAVPDHRGHGRSGGKRLLARDLSEFTADLETLRRLEVVDGRPTYLLGHSMGGEIALDYALDHQDVLAALVLSAPAVLPGDDINPVLIKVAKVHRQGGPRACPARSSAPPRSPATRPWSRPTTRTR